MEKNDTLMTGDCLNRKACSRFMSGSCWNGEEECYCNAWSLVSTRESFNDPHNITGLCEAALNGECPYEKKILCIKGSHDVCLTGKFQESQEGKMKKNKDEKERKYRQPNSCSKWMVLANGSFAIVVDVGS
jgi:hypothetical protein